MDKMIRAAEREKGGLMGQEILPRAQDQDQAHSNLLLLRHLQAPQRHDGHDDEHPVGADVQDGLRERDVVETRRGAQAERVARRGQHDGEDDGEHGADEGDPVQGEPVRAARVDAVVQHDEGELGEGGRPEVGHAEKEEHLWVARAQPPLAGITFLRVSWLTYILIAHHSALCDTPEMFAEAARHDFDHADEGR